MHSSLLTPKLKEQESIDLSKYHPRQRTNIRMYGLDCKDWTPQDVTDYKRKWMQSAEEVRVNQSVFGLDECVKWCKINFYHQDFQVKKYARSDDSHTIYFKNPEEAMLFKICNA
tara:strand:- start:34 stop:375 length:342 start_codon:yes stop_codon:yes gene_type:complete